MKQEMSGPMQLGEPMTMQPLNINCYPGPDYAAFSPIFTSIGIGPVISVCDDHSFQKRGIGLAKGGSRAYSTIISALYPLALQQRLSSLAPAFINGNRGSASLLALHYPIP